MAQGATAFTRAGPPQNAAALGETGNPFRLARFEGFCHDERFSPAFGESRNMHASQLVRHKNGYLDMQ